MYIVKRNKKVRGSKKFVDFQNFQKFNKNRILFGKIFEILIITKPSLGPCEVPHKMWARFVVYWIQTDRKEKYFYRCIKE